MRIFLVNNSRGAIGNAAGLSVANDGKPVVIGTARPSNDPSWSDRLQLRSVDAEQPDMEVFLEWESGDLRHYGVRIVGDVTWRGTDTMDGTRVQLDGDDLTVTVDHVFDPWMARVPGHLQLHQITIPGTHNSGTFDMWGADRCQHLTILEQLYAGVRYFDLRVDTGTSPLAICHAGTNTRYTLDEVIGTFCKVLHGDHGFPAGQETIVVQIKVDAGGDDDIKGDEIIASLTAACSGSPDTLHLDAIGPEGPSLRHLRGKLVVLRRFEVPATAKPNGTPVKYFVPLDVYQQYYGTTDWGTKFKDERFEWRDPGSGNIDFRNEDGKSFRLQDNYDALGWGKRNIVTRLLDDTASGMMPDSWVLNFTSGRDPGNTADLVNAGLDDWLDKAAGDESLARYGTILMDFVTPSLCRKLIAKNEWRR